MTPNRGPVSESAMKSPGGVSDRANRMILEGDLEGALRLLKSHLVQAPLDNKLVTLAGSLLEGQASIDFYRDLHKLAPDDWRLVVQLAGAYSQTGKDSLAVVQLQKLLRNETDHPEVWMELANCYKRLEKSELALRALCSLIDIQPNYAPAHVARLRFLLDTKDLEEATAASIFSLEIQDLPTSLRDWFDKVNLQLEQGLMPTPELLGEDFGTKSSTPAQAKATSTALALTERQKTQQLLCFTMMLAILVKGGLSFSRIFGILAPHQGALLGTVIQKLEKSVMRDGEPLSKAFAHHPDVFPDQYLAMVEMGESTNLSRCLDRLCEQLKLQYLKGQPREETRPALALACRNLADALEASGSEAQALAWATRACSDDAIRLAMQDLEKQVLSGMRLAECKFPAVFTSLITSLVAAHDAVGTAPTAFKDLARLLER